VIADKPAETAVPIHPLLADRWSGRAFDSRDVTRPELVALLEAARWAPSSANEQPWRFVVVRPGDASRDAVLAGMTGANPRWAGNAPVLLVTVARATMEKTGRPNRYAWHDVGLATAQLAAEATALGLATHIMAGWSAEALRAALAIPEGFDPVAVIAIGHHGDAALLPDDLRERELAPRTRRPLDTIAFRDRFGLPCLDEPSPAAALPSGAEP